MSIVIRGGTVVNADTSFKADVYCHDGIIKNIGVDIEVPLGTEVIDASGQYVMPGGIDSSYSYATTFYGHCCY